MSVIVVAIAVFLLCFNIIFRKNGRFPETEIGKNEEMKKRGIVCAKSEERQLWAKNEKSSLEACDGCALRESCKLN